MKMKKRKEFSTTGPWLIITSMTVKPEKQKGYFLLEILSLQPTFQKNPRMQSDCSGMSPKSSLVPGRWAMCNGVSKRTVSLPHLAGLYDGWQLLKEWEQNAAGAQPNCAVARTSQLQAIQVADCSGTC